MIKSRYNQRKMVMIDESNKNQMRIKSIGVLSNVTWVFQGT